MIDHAGIAALVGSTNKYTITDTYVIGAHTVTTEDHVIERGPLRSQLGLAPATLDVTIMTGGTAGILATLKADVLDGTLDGATFTYSRTYATAGTVTRFIGTVQRAEAASASVRIVAISASSEVGVKKFPPRLYTPSCGWEFKSTECGYVGIETGCDKSWAACETRSNTERFGGMRELPDPANYNIR